MSESNTPPFEDSRRLTGPNRHFTGTGAELEALPPASAAQQTQWHAAVTAAFAALGWTPGKWVVHAHRSGVTLAFEAPVDGLYTATELNEWAWSSACGWRAFHAPGHPASHDGDSALHTLQRMAAAEREPALIDALVAARGQDIPVLLDDDLLSLGYGCRGQSWPRSQPPSAAEAGLRHRGLIPTALVTGSNGKTTTVRLISALLRASGKHVGHSCTDGVLIDGVAIETGDFSGPMGARSALRHPQIEAAVLETARGGLLRRGLAVERAHVAVVTNIAVDHFGEYGIHDLEGLAAAKLVVSRALSADGCLILNADDPILRRIGIEKSGVLRDCRADIAWFSLDPDFDWEATKQACVVRDGHLLLRHQGQTHDLGAVDAMPLSAHGQARYNVANLAAAALAAVQMGVAPSTLRDVLSRFGSDPADNPGRLERHQVGGATILLDYAHNPDGLDGLLRIAQAERGDGRLALLLGQAGNREDSDIRALAAIAAAHQPDLVVLKDLDGYMRGRQDGEVPALLRDELQARGQSESSLIHSGREMDAVQTALRWARPGDMLVLPVHTLSVRYEVLALFEQLRTHGWLAGNALPN